MTFCHFDLSGREKYPSNTLKMTSSDASTGSGSSHLTFVTSYADNWLVSSALCLMSTLCLQQEPVWFNAELQLKLDLSTWQQLPAGNLTWGFQPHKPFDWLLNALASWPHIVAGQSVSVAKHCLCAEHQLTLLLQFAYQQNPHLWMSVRQWDLFVVNLMWSFNYKGSGAVW